MRRLVVPTLASLVAGSLLTGCPDRSLSEVDPIQDHVHKASIPVNLNRNVDILFVIDDSGSMSEEQVSLRGNFPNFINVLSTIEGGLPDVHIGIVSTNVGTGGVNLNGCSTQSQPNGDDGNLLTNGCPNLTGTFVDDRKDLATGDRIKNYSGELPELFSCMANLGISGCGFEQPLESMYRALQLNKNPGFLRDDAYLAIVFLGDEDDCSAKEGGALFGDPTGSITSTLGPRTSFRCHEFGIECDNDPNPRALGPRTGCVPRVGSQYMKDVQPYIDYVKQLKPGHTDRIIVAGIIGNVDAAHSVDVVADPDDGSRPAVGPSCTSGSGNAFPGFRIQAFLDAFPERNFTTTICNDNLTDAMTEIGNIIKIAVGSPCIPAPLSDRNPNIDGTQPECSVADVTNPDDEEARAESIIPACDTNGNVAPCWRFISDPVQCADAPDNRAIEINRNGASVPSGTVLEVQCVTCTASDTDPTVCAE